jgi:hypothetical protein
MRRLFSLDGPDRAWYSHRWLALTIGLVILLGLAFVYSPTVLWVLAAALVGFGLLAIRDRIRIRRLIAERAGEGLGTFVRDEAIRSADPRILRAVFEGLQDAMVAPARPFPCVRATNCWARRFISTTEISPSSCYLRSRAKLGVDSRLLTTQVLARFAQWVISLPSSNSALRRTPRAVRSNKGLDLTR